MNRKTASIAMALTLALAISGNVLAAPSNTPTSLKQVQDQKRDLERKVEQLDSEIVHVMQNIDKNKKDIENISKDIKKSETDLATAEKNIQGQQELFNKRVRAMYINGVDSYLGVILESNNLGDFISRIENVKKVINFDNKAIGDLKDKKQAISKQRQALDEKNKKLLTLKADNEKKLSKLSNDKANQQQMVKNLENKEKELAAAGISDTRLVASAADQVQKIRAAAPRISRGASGGSVTPASSSSIVAYASNFIGTPYQWGGTGPSTFDCSGFTSYVYSHFGISLPRVSEDQQNVGTPVASDKLQPGDLVFFGSPAHHVGIYVGNGAYIHAPHSGDVVKISPINRSDYSGARRVK
ncbi:C40 family peptidase [Clostridium sp. DJ247]|uniref:C40 family peptidase n=1 Tax=Clostridium sp. DJ247 TaxID=2726188 RepID=UPI0016282395|nr:C40 family peptidase [Clostridium sp. DJ247]MBC2581254.1 glycoside hydrolase [Clostridium sp. DJ247]